MLSALQHSETNPNRADRELAIRDSLERMEDRLNGILQGKRDVIRMVVVCLLAQGHLLLEDKPGLGKTTLAKGLARALGGEFSRLQCTPDLLPGDITGFSIFNQRSHEFEFRHGPVFADVLLADEINRATPRAQSALLEAMAERQVTVDAHRYRLSPQFFVIATQNPIEQHGTYPLPEAQLDRFAMKLSVGYPDREDESRMLAAAVGGTTQESTDQTPVLSPGELAEAQAAVARVHVSSQVRDYLLDFAHQTRRHPRVLLGTSPRGLLIWQRVAQAHAFLAGQNFVTPDDVQQTALPVLGVRLTVEHGDPRPVIHELLESLPVPDGLEFQPKRMEST